jgi:hypothetical protein
MFPDGSRAYISTALGGSLNRRESVKHTRHEQRPGNLSEQTNAMRCIGRGLANMPFSCP